MALFAMSAFLLSAPKLLGLQWELFRWIIPVLVLIVVCRVASGDERLSDMPFVQPLLALLFCWISYSMENKDQPTEYRRRRNKRTKVCPSPSPPPPRRKTRKDRKKRPKMERPRDDEPPPPSPATAPLQPLPEFHSLNMDESEIYSTLCHLVLSNAQLLHNDYPLDSPDCPGRAHTRSSLPAHVTKRKCARCRAQFDIVHNVYLSTTQCLHHFPVKRCPNTGRYQCCNGDSSSPGCMVSPYHVTAQHSFDGVPFHRIREKRQVKGGEFCNVFSLDCEMSYTTAGLEVVKVALVGLDGLTVYETYVKPDNMVLDYNTRYSGVTAEHLKRVTTSLADVQAYLLKNLNKSSILVGHALANDLKALRIIHDRVVDTSVVFPHRDNASWKYSLRTLAQQHLGRDIQDGQHDCVEDARTCLALVLKFILTNPDVIPFMVNPAQARSNYFKESFGVFKPWNSGRVRHPVKDGRPGTYAEVVTKENGHDNKDRAQWVSGQFLLQDDLRSLCRQQATKAANWDNCHSMSMLSQFSMARNLRC